MATYNLVLTAAGVDVAANNTALASDTFIWNDVAALKLKALFIDADIDAIIDAANIAGTIVKSNANKTLTIGGLGQFDIVGADLNHIKFTPAATLNVNGNKFVIGNSAGGTAKWSALDASATTAGIVIQGNETASTLTAGSGNDSINGGAAADTMLGKLGQDTFTVNTGADLASDYKYSEGDVITGSFTAATETSIVNLAGTTIVVDIDGEGAGADNEIVATMNGIAAEIENGVYKAYVKNTNTASNIFAQNTLTETWFASTAGATMDASAITNAVFLKGNTGNDVISGNDKANYIVSGGGNDAIWGGKGTDTIVLTSATDNTAQTIWFSGTDGTDNITNFQKGFNATDDVIKIWGKTDVLDGVTFTGAANSTLTVGSDVLTLTNVTDTAVIGGVQLKLKNEKDVTKKIWFTTATSATLVANSAIGNSADVYVGTTGITQDKVDFGAETAGLFAWLGDSSKFKSIERVVGGAANDTLSGGSTADTIEGGLGSDQIWGGSSDIDLLYGGVVGAADAVADSFWFASGDGQDSIADYSYAAGDKVKLYNSAYDKIVSDTSVVKDATNIKITNGKDTLLVRNTTASSQNVTLVDKNNKTVKLAVTEDATLNYTDGVKLYYGAAGLSTTLKITTTGTAANVYLGNGYDGIVTNDLYFANVTNIDASTSTSDNVLCGNSAANLIIAGSGNTGMWGAGAAADTMKGGAGVDSFWFGTGDGKDVVQSASNLDKVVLYNNALADLAGTIDGSNLVITTKAGDTLTITNWATTAADARINTFQIGADAAAKSYSFDSSTKTFVAK